MAAAALVVSVTNSISFVKELLESAGDAPPSHEILVECEVVLTKCLADLAHISSDGELHDLVNAMLTKVRSLNFTLLAKAATSYLSEEWWLATAAEMPPVSCSPTDSGYRWQSRPSHLGLLQALQFCGEPPAPFESRRLLFEWRAWTWRESRGGSIMYLCLFVTSSSGMYWYSMEGEVVIYSMFFYIKK